MNLGENIEVGWLDRTRVPELPGEFREVEGSIPLHNPILSILRCILLYVGRFHVHVKDYSGLWRITGLCGGLQGPTRLPRRLHVKDYRALCYLPGGEILEVLLEVLFQLVDLRVECLNDEILLQVLLHHGPHVRVLRRRNSENIWWGWWGGTVKRKWGQKRRGETVRVIITQLISL